MTSTTTETLIAEARTARLGELGPTLDYLRRTFRCQLSDDAAWAKDDAWITEHVTLHEEHKL